MRSHFSICVTGGVVNLSSRSFRMHSQLDHINNETNIYLYFKIKDDQLQLNFIVKTRQKSHIRKC